jgi:hypothetical protein
MNYTLTRTEQGDDGTFGNLADETGMVLCVTCEPPPTGPHPCIHDGQYVVMPHDSPTHPGTWELQDVPGRTAILIHGGNTENDTLGCIIVGDRMGWINGLRAVLDSKITLKTLRAELPSSFTLTIKTNMAN